MLFDQHSQLTPNCLRKFRSSHILHGPELASTNDAHLDGLGDLQLGQLAR